MSAVDIHGSYAPAYQRVAEEFARNFTARGELGAAVAAFVDGELVVNLWGGWIDPAGTRPWHVDTLSTVLSGTKGITSTCVHHLVERGVVELDAPIARYWPEFAQAGKADVTLAMVLSHRSGVIGPRAPMPWQDVTDWDLVCTRIAAAEPWWAPGTAQGYHMTTYGFIVGEVMRRVTGGTVGEYLQAEVAGPLGAEIHIGVPADEQPHRCADPVDKPTIRQMLGSVNAPTHPTSLADHPKAGLAVAMGFAPDDEIATNDLTLWRQLGFPAPTGRSRRWAPRRSTTRWPRRSCSAARTWTASGSARAGWTPTWCWARGSPTTAGGWDTCSTSAASTAPTRTSSATAGWAAPSGSSTWSTGSATPM